MVSRRALAECTARSSALWSPAACAWHTIPSERIHADAAVLPMGGGQEFTAFQAMDDYFGPVILYVPSASEWFDAAILCCLRPRVLFAYGPDVSSATAAAYEGIGIDYVCLPFASDPSVMRPLSLPPSYNVASVGSAGHARRRLEFLAPLLREFPPDRVLVLGSGWERFCVPDQQVAWGPLLNILYNLATVCVNIHSAEQVRGRDSHLDANNRLFDLAMAGRCQVSDNSGLVRDYFSSDELVTADEPRAWVQRVRELVAHPEVAGRYGARARERALDSHTWDVRAGVFIEELAQRLEVRSAAGAARLSIGPVLRSRLLAKDLEQRARRAWRGRAR